MNIAEKLVTIAEKMPNVYIAGQKSEYDRFWDSYQNYGEVVHGLCMFAGHNWTDDIYMPKYSFKVDAFSSMYQNSPITDVKVPIDFTYGTGINVFYNATKLKNIPLITVSADNKFENWFYSCNELEKVGFEGVIGNSIDLHWSTKLSTESYDSIFNCLSTTSVGQTLTLPTTAEATYDAKYGNCAWTERVKEFANWEFKYA